MTILTKPKPVHHVPFVSNARADTEGNVANTGFRSLRRSLAVKLMLLLIVFVAVPVVIFLQFHEADIEKNKVMLRVAQEQGALIARALTPLLQDFDGKSVKPVSDMVRELAAGQSNIKLLFRPKAADGLNNFYYVASAPEVSPNYLQEEGEELVRQGILGKVDTSCVGEFPRTYRYTNPAGHEELITSIQPVNVGNGCWAVITSRTTDAYLSSSLGRPYWEMPVVKIAGAIYLLMALVVAALVIDIGRTLRRFGRLARLMRLGVYDDASFAKHNRIPELHPVAQEFDGLVDSLRSSKLMIRQAAEENAHALKAPLGVICQAIEPLRRAIPPENERGQRSIRLIEQSVQRLDSLVSALRQMDEAIAELIRPARRPMNFSELVSGIATAYAENWSDGGPALRCDIAPGIWVIANEELIETVVENIFDNARSFSPPDGTIFVRVFRSGGDVVLSVEDRGPGVPAEHLDRIFMRYFSARPEHGTDLRPVKQEYESHSGIGLWVVRRNVEVFGGSVQAENVPDSGLRILVTLPIAD